MVKDREGWHAAVHWVTESDTTDRLNNNIYFLGGSDGKGSVCNVRELGSILGWEDPLEDGMATHSNILAWRIPMNRQACLATVHGVIKSQT